MVNKTVLHTLKSGLVLDRSVFSSMPATDMAYVISNIRAAKGLPLYVVDSAEQFFTTDSLMVLVGKKDRRALLVNEALGDLFTSKQINLLMGDVIKPAAVDEGLIVNLGAQPQGQQGGYQFAPVPPGWSMSGNMSLGATKIKRKIKNNDGDGVMFAMSPANMEKLWLLASQAWCGIEYAPLSGTFDTWVGTFKAYVQDDRISIGGHYIRRYEIEQIAKYRNWAMPMLKAA